MAPAFRKELPGAECFFQPDDLADYEDDAWDIRISLPEQPLDEAFYFTIDDPVLAEISVGRLLEDFALNVSRRNALDVEDYPDLPFLQEELAQYWMNGEKGLLELSFHVNNDPSPAPLDLHTPASHVMGVCRYLDDSHDYRLLDLVMVATIPDSDPTQAAQAKQETGSLQLLLSLDCLEDDDWDRFELQPTVQAWLRQHTQGSPALAEALSALEDRGDLAKGMGEDGAPTLDLSEQGQRRAAECWSEAERLDQTYAPYASVSVHPPALGVPGGFDIRTQLMEVDGLDLFRAIALGAMHGDESLTDAFELEQSLKSEVLFRLIRHTLAYRTGFTGDTLSHLRKI
ncbi:MAG: hypothetical protein KAI66_05085 [Lentisphaeria bacterium]|nr:hypothetical protein [Lentisphaeria bacterium]